jgi:succinate--hydroxymethylglutarate CoA-transferase
LIGILVCHEIADDKSFGTIDQRAQNSDDLEIVPGGSYMKKTSQEWLTTLEGSGIRYGPTDPSEDSFELPQVDPRDMIDAMDFEATVCKQLRIVSV